MKFILQFMLISSALSQKVDKCPKLKTKPLDVKQYVGKWYAVSQLEEPYQKCTTYDVMSDDDNHLTCLIKGVNEKTGKTNIGKWYGKVTKSEAKVTFLNATFPIQKIKSFWILDTDYTCYAVLWSCESDMQSKKFTWILTREQYPSEEILEKGYKIVSQYGITKELMKKIDKKNCS